MLGGTAVLAASMNRTSDILTSSTVKKVKKSGHIPEGDASRRRQGGPAAATGPEILSRYAGRGGRVRRLRGPRGGRPTGGTARDLCAARHSYMNYRAEPALWVRLEPFRYTVKGTQMRWVAGS